MKVFESLKHILSLNIQFSILARVHVIKNLHDFLVLFCSLVFADSNATYLIYFIRKVLAEIKLFCKNLKKAVFFENSKKWSKYQKKKPFLNNFCKIAISQPKRM